LENEAECSTCFYFYLVIITFQQWLLQLFLLLDPRLCDCITVFNFMLSYVAFYFRKVIADLDFNYNYLLIKILPQFIFIFLLHLLLVLAIIINIIVVLCLYITVIVIVNESKSHN